MSRESNELREVAASLRALLAQADDPAVQEPLQALEDAAAQVAKAWSGSSIGFHSCIYYAGLELPPPGAHFSQEWGFLGMFQGTTGDWHEYPYDAVRDHIFAQAGHPDLSAPRDLAADATRALAESRSTIASILTGWIAEQDDGFISKLEERLRELVVLDPRRATELQINRGPVMTRDATALGQGLRAAPHQEIVGLVVGCRSPLSACGELADIAEQAAAHMERVARRRLREEAKVSGSYVFIGHGRSPLWRELKDFVQDRLRLACDEFNRVPVAGVTNVERLVQMLDDAAIALLVLTAEDEKIDGSVSARQNVVHEAGLFQGRLGFSRAIVLMEEGCEQFSNIAGLGQIRFPEGNIPAAFEEVRRVMEREGLI
ncbi:MAG TPA: TIR domain-containing protein [Acidimicrobiales bacterium]|nr:TIR domain-containing protein [Acidimicrobiales bacterium]